MASPFAVHPRPIGAVRTSSPSAVRHLIVAVFLVVACPLPEVAWAWREDPRPAADTPAGVELPPDAQSPPGRRGSRRSQRRSSRRRQPLDELPIELPIELPAARAAVPEPIQTTATPAAPVPPASEDAASLTTHRDQPYGPAPQGQPRHGRQRFDLYLPAGCNAGGMPLVVWIHGDTWRDGSKADCPIVWLANEGYAVASIGYRLSDTAVFPAQLDDCREAIAEIERNADVWGIDRSRVAVVGSGAGGHLAALVGLASPAITTSATTPDTRGDVLPRIAAVCAVATPASLTTLGPVHDRPGSPASRLVGGPLPEFREAAQRASPVTHVSADDPPVLILHGAADGTVPARQAVEFDAALKAAGVDSTLVVLANVGHSLELGLGTPAGQALLAFLDRALGAGIRPQHAPLP
jgi:acetyl esterase/lipase